MAIYGRSGSDSDMGFIGPGAARVSVFEPMSEHGWGYRMGGRIGRYSGSSGTAAVRFAIYDTSGTGGAPDDLRGRTAEFSVANVMGSAGAANSYLQNINAAPGSPDNNAVMLYSGNTYAMGYFSTSAQLAHQMVSAANADYANETFYNRTGIGSTTPTDPYGYNSTQFEGMLNVYIEYDPNVAPSKPTSGLAPVTTTNSLTPTFTADFVDGNTGRGDKLNQLNIELREVGLTARKWASTYDATASEISAGAMSRAYAGSALTAGVPYEWRVRFSDQFGAWGAWSNWTTFTVNAGGSVATPTSPSGKQETNTPTPFSAVWSHGSSLSTNAAEVRIKSGTTVVKGPFQKAVVVANGGTISFTWAETGFTALEWGKNFTAEIRGRDSAGLWSNWSTGKAFSTNAYPSVPSSLSPANGATVSALPLISFTMTDIDDTTATGLTAEIRIKNSGGTLLFTRTATFNATTNKWEYQVTGTDFASFATYKWDARGRDGTLDSAYSAERTIVYGAGPNVSNVQLNGVAANGSTPATNTPTVTWTLTGSTQQSFIVQIYAYPYTVGDTPIYDSGTVVSATASHVIPSGYLHNGIAYDLRLTVTNTVPLSGTFGAYTFTVTFPALTPIAGFSATPTAVAGDVAGQTSTVTLGWTLPDDTPSTFIENIITRTEIGDSTTEIILARLTSLDQTSFIDHFPQSNTTYEYAIYKVAYQGTDITESAPATSVASVNFDYAIISSALSPSARRVALRINRSTSIDHKGDKQYLFTWGDDEPTGIVESVHYDVVSGVYFLYDSPFQSVESALSVLDDLHELFEIVCYRDERKKKIFGLMDYKEDYESMRRSAISLTVTQTNFKEGVT